MILTAQQIQWAHDECDRQEASEGLPGLLKALTWAQVTCRDQMPLPTSLQQIARFVAPRRNAYQWGDTSSWLYSTNYRCTPVAFRDGGSSCPYARIPEAVDRVFLHVPRVKEEGVASELVDNICRHLLWIHPFEDGNGRAMSVLYNWLKETLNEPQMLPFYFGEEGVERIR